MFGIKQNKLRWRELLVYFPAWTPPLVVLLFAYVMANFFFAAGHLPPRGTAAGMPTGAEAVYLARAFSGHWLVVYTVPMLVFAFVPSDARPPADAIDGTV